MAGSWIEAIIALWVLISPWLLGFSGITVMRWSNVAAGTIFLLLAVWHIFGQDGDAKIIKGHKSQTHLK